MANNLKIPIQKKLTSLQVCACIYVVLDKAKPFGRGGRKAAGLISLRWPRCRKMNLWLARPTVGMRPCTAYQKKIPVTMEEEI
jgi:hypothetical protein